VIKKWFLNVIKLQHS